MEPLNIVVDLRADAMTLWCGSQFQTIDQVLARRPRDYRGKGRAQHDVRGRRFWSPRQSELGLCVRRRARAKALRESGVKRRSK